LKEDEASGSVTFSRDDAGTARVQTKPMGAQFMCDEPWAAKLHKPTKAPIGEQQPGVLGSLRCAGGDTASVGLPKVLKLWPGGNRR
jgi:hypothetical protein